jgi:primosomal protein N' (replication factor Y)
MTHYYEVAPSTNKYHGSEALTYQATDLLDIGQIVEIKVRGRAVPGFVVQQVPKPAFKTQTLEPTSYQLPEICVQLFSWIQDFYPGSTGLLAQHFLSSSSLKYLQSIDEAVLNMNKLQIDAASLPKLTEEQNNVVESITNSIEQTQLLHGETGSGKTRVYIELALKTLKAGKSALILTPEISLTPQLVKSFEAVFGSHVVLMHSGLTPSAKKKAWQRILVTDQPLIIIGPRSALFAPIRKLGLLIIDEFHDSAYKQDSSPFYHAIRVASALAHLHQAKLVMGSATPSVNEYYLAEQKNIPVLRMTKLPAQTGNAPVTTHLVDLTKPEEKTSHFLLSKTLLGEIGTALQRKDQSLIFLNRRGSSRAITCQVCGWQSVCPRCDLPFIYHHDDHALRCHTCGMSAKPPSQCPECNSTDIIFKNPGTKAIVSTLEKIFPQAVVARFDRDNTKLDRIEARHSDIVDGTIDILVGTQLLTKGHDLPRLGLAAVVLAESGLDFPDYTAEERSFQTIRQLMGRVNRGHRPGTVVIQTFDPNNSTITEAVSGKWSDFYHNQLKERETFGFPPLFHVMKIEVARASQASAKASALQTIKKIQAMNRKVMIVGPTPSFLEKRANKWHWQFIVKAKSRAELVMIAQNISTNCQINLDPVHLL